uniref:T9SS type A sorting domain-containing protein n=1 Tax=Gelidibacter sp. TaxID=2018083 RepID=UPI00404AE517
MKQILHSTSFNLLKKQVIIPTLALVCLFSFQTVNSQITDQNFNGFTDDSYASTQIDLDGIRYTGGNGTDIYVAVDNSTTVSPNTSMTGNAMVIGNNTSEVDGYAEFKTINSSINFKLVSLVIETYSLSGGYDSEYRVIGYDNGSEIVSVDLDMQVSGTYGTGDDSIIYNRNMASTAGGSTSGMFTFGNSWENIDHVRFQTVNGTENFYYVGLDNIDFEPAVVPNTISTVSNVAFSGTLQVGEMLTGSYDFNDADLDADQSTYQWFRSDDALGTNKTAINSATTINYTLVENDEDIYISFEVTPYDGMDFGTESESDLLGPVLSETLNVSEPEFNDTLVSIFPNPAKSFVIISNLQSSQISNIQIYDIKGSLITKYILNSLVSDYKFNTENLFPGIYILKIQNKQGITVTKKLVVE